MDWEQIVQEMLSCYSNKKYWYKHLVGRKWDIVKVAEHLQKKFGGASPVHNQVMPGREDAERKGNQGDIIVGKYKLCAHNAENGQVWLKVCKTGEGVLLGEKEIEELYLKHF